MPITLEGTPLREQDVADTVAALAIGDAALWAVIQVETAGSGFIDSRKPAILFERHKFSAATGHQFDATHPGISNKQAGGYGAAGEHQYQRLREACSLNAKAALESASWGLGQVMGSNATSLGYSSVQEFVRQMCASEGQQLRAMMLFMQQNHLGPLLAHADWTEFARRYNGPNFALNKYDQKLAQRFVAMKAGPKPDLRVRTAQLMLRYLCKADAALDPGRVDGWMGRITRSAISEFQHKHGLPDDGALDDATLDALVRAPKPGDASLGLPGL